MKRIKLPPKRVKSEVKIINTKTKFRFLMCIGYAYKRIKVQTIFLSLNLWLFAYQVKKEQTVQKEKTRKRRKETRKRKASFYSLNFFLKYKG